MTHEYLIAGLPAMSGQSGCLLCRTCEEAEQVWLRWFLAEKHSDPALLRALYGSAGFCPAHTRRLFAQAAPHVLQRPLVHALRGAVARLERLTAVRRPRRQQRKPSARCPLCRVIMERERAAAEDVAATLAQPGTAAGLADRDGVCCKHLAGLLPRLSAAQAAVAAEIVAGRLAALRAGAPESLLVLAGLDADALARVPYLTAHARLLREEPHAGARSARVSAASRLIADLAAGACPVCHAAGREQVRYLLWLGDSLAGADGSAGAGLQLCAWHLLDARHLYDVGGAARTGSWLVSAVSASSYAQAVALTAAAREVLAAPRAGRQLRRSGSASQGSAERAAEAFGAAARAMTGDRSCRACWVGLDAERRQLSLLRACLLDTGVLRAVGDAHGLCLRHAAVLAADGDARPVLSRLMTQLRQAQWELDEGAAKRAWDRRHEPKGHEQDAWRCAPALIDGAVDLGIPVSGRGGRHAPAS